MRIEQLEYLIEIVRQNSFIAASEILHITPQALSNNIKCLEEELNVKIFFRSNRGVKLTSEGQKVFSFAQKTILHYRDLKSTLDISHPYKKELSGNLIVHTSAIYLDTILTKYLEIFKNQYPQINIEINQSSSIQTLSNLDVIPNSTTSNVGMFLLPFFNDSPIPEFIPSKTSTYKLYSYNQYYAVVSYKSEFGNLRSTSLNKLLQHPIVVCTSNNSVNHPLITILRKYHPDLQIAATVSTMSFLATAIRADLGIGFIPKFVFSSQNIKTIFNDLRLLTFKEPVITANCLLYHENDPIESAFVDQFPNCRIPKWAPKYP